MTMADTVAVMNAGTVEQLGAPEDLYETPRSTFVANFLGTSNLLPGTVDAATSGGDVALTSRGTRLVVSAARCAVPPRAGGALLLGVRPEKVTLVPVEDEARIADGRNRVRGRIADSSFIGASTQYVLDTPGRGRFEVYAQNIERDPRLTPGAEVVAHWNPAHGFGLDAEQDIDAGVATAGDEGDAA